MDHDLQVRNATFHWLQAQIRIHGDVLPRTLLQQGFEFPGERVPLVSPQGIFKPRMMDLPLTISTTPRGPYTDDYAEGSYLSYRYRGTDANHPDNVGLRELMHVGRPLIYFFGVMPGRYLAVFPVYIIGDDPSSLTFQVAVDDLAALRLDVGEAIQVSEEAEGRRMYVTATTKVRLHQRNFREKVLEAYRSQCSFCCLRHRELLDAAHIIPDNEPGGHSKVDNGLALCKLHHAAFDSFILGVTPDYVIQVRQDILREVDGPILQHGIQELEGLKIQLPSDSVQWPSQGALAWKFEKFLLAA